jgi:membrane protease YdiL (CAAX protease family)
MHTIASVIKRRPLVTFFMLAYTFSWWGWVVGSLYPPIAPYTPYPFFAPGPLLAALVVLPISQGRAGLRALAASLLKWRVRWHWYALAIGIPLTVGLGAAMLNAGFGAPFQLAQLSVWSMLQVFAIRLINPIDGPLGEEPGWRGYALPAFQAKTSPLIAALIVGLLAAGWHLPIFLVGAASPFEVFAPFALGIVASWLYNRTGGSALLALVLHAADGLIQIERLGFLGADAERMVWLYSGLWCIIALGVVALDRDTWRSRRPAAVSPITTRPVAGG